MGRAKRTRMIAVLVWCGLLLLLVGMGLLVLGDEAWALPV